MSTLFHSISLSSNPMKGNHRFLEHSSLHSTG